MSLPFDARSVLPSLHQGGDGSASLEFLRILQIHQLSKVPFENLSIHYSAHHTVSLDADTLYEKIVGNARGRGGYCMENNCFFGTILRTLGFKVYSAGARVFESDEGGGTYTPWY